MIAGLENITSGQLYIDDALVNDVDSKDRDIAMVFQNYALYPHMTVFQNMAFGLKLRKEDPKEIEKRVKEAAEILEIEDLLSRNLKPSPAGSANGSPSGGPSSASRKCSCSMSRSATSMPNSGFRCGPRSPNSIRKLETTFIYVTHDQTEAMTMGDRIVVMKLGYIQQVDTPVNLYENPANLFVATFLGSPQMNILACRLEEKDGKLYAELKDSSEQALFPVQKAKQLTDRSYVGQDVLLGIRPEHISIGEKGIPAEVDVVEQLGDETIVYAKIAGREEDVVIKGTATGKYKAKDKISLVFDMEKAHLFDKDSSVSIMGIPSENRFPCKLFKDKAVFGKNEFVFSPEYKAHLFEEGDGKEAYLCIGRSKVSLSPVPEALKLEAKIDFIDRQTDSANVFATVEGLSQYLAFPTAPDTKLKEGERIVAYIKESDVQFKDKSGDLLSSREVILPNEIEAEFTSKGNETQIRFGTNKLLLPKMEASDGKHLIALDETKVHPVFSRKALKSLERKQLVSDRNREIKASAYDEEQLGQKNAVFVQISGLNHYATFILPASFSVYKVPKFSLYLEDGAIKIIK
jgi:multiple sugar transport system ATP-binding protein